MQLNDKLKDELSLLNFTLEDGTILDNNVHAMILLLIDDFNKCFSSGLKNNLELSQNYYEGKKINGPSDNCELVLKYNNNDICPVDNDKSQVDNDNQCNVNRGSITFHLKKEYNESNGVCYRYHKLKVVRIKEFDENENYDNIYVDNEQLEKKRKVKNAILSQIQDKNIKNYVENKMKTMDMNKVSEKIQSIISETDKATTGYETSELKNILKDMPNPKDLELSKKISSSLKNLPNNYKVILTSGKKSISTLKNKPISVNLGTETKISEINPSIPVDLNLVLTENLDKLKNKMDMSKVSVLSDNSNYKLPIDNKTIDRIKRNLGKKTSETKDKLFSPIQLETLKKLENTDLGLSSIKTTVKKLDSEPYMEYIDSVKKSYGTINKRGKMEPRIKNGEKGDELTVGLATTTELNPYVLEKTENLKDSLSELSKKSDIIKTTSEI